MIKKRLESSPTTPVTSSTTIKTRLILANYNYFDQLGSQFVKFGFGKVHDGVSVLNPLHENTFETSQELRS